MRIVSSGRLARYWLTISDDDQRQPADQRTERRSVQELVGQQLRRAEERGDETGDREPDVRAGRAAR